MTESVRVPPQDLDAEQVVLGSVILDNDALDTVSAIIGPDDFYSGAHKVIYQTMLAMQKDKQTIDALTLISRLRSNKRLDVIGGQAYIATLVNATPNAANVAQHSRIVQEHSLRRRMIERLGMVTQWAYDGGTFVHADVAEHLWQMVEDVSGSNRAAVTCVPPGVLAQTTLDAMQERFERQELKSEFSTGLKQLDKLTLGLHRSEFTVVAGRPGSGKTALALQIAAELAFFQQKSVMFLSMEMSREELAMRLASCFGYIDGYHIRSGRLTQDDWDNFARIMNYLAESRLHIDDASFNTPTEVRAKCRRIRRRYGLDVIFADYLQLMHVPGKRSRQEEIAEISRQGKALAKDMKVPVVFLSQLNRATESRADSKPTLADLRESGAIEQDADAVLFTHRYDLKDKCTCDWQLECTCGKRGKAEITIGKQRNGPAGIDIPMLYIGKHFRFEEKEAT